MKLTAGKRILMFFHWLMSVAICAAFTLYLVKREFIMDLYNRVAGGLTATQLMVCGIAILAVYVILSVAQLITIFRRGRKGDRGFITVDSSDSGRVRIAVSAIEQMVRQSVTNIDGIHEMKVAIASDDDAIKIDIAAIIVGGSHVPTITMNMQRAIRQFVEMNCGVAVRSVSISINSVTSAQESKGRRGRGRKDEAPVTPSPAAVNASRPVESYAPVSEPEPEPVAPATPEPPVYEAPQTFEEPRPIKLTLDYEPAPAGEPSEVPEVSVAEEDASEAPEEEIY